jgi:hypothetical protein
MELDNFIIGKNRGEERRVGQKSNWCLPKKIEQLLPNIE